MSRAVNLGYLERKKWFLKCALNGVLLNDSDQRDFKNRKQMNKLKIYLKFLIYWIL